ncbi:thioredoxin family protein [Pilimelia terevasa]|nr:thioredoxin family protein [Pilimelia terevasa]
MTRVVRAALSGVVVGAMLCGGAAAAAAPVSASPATVSAGPPLEVDVTAANWDQVAQYSAEKPVVLDFGAELCLGCKEIAKDLHGIVQQDGGAWMVGSVDRDAYPELHARLNVTTLPTLVVLRNGKEQSAVVPRFTGYAGGSKEWTKLWRWIQDVKNGDYPPAMPADPNIEIPVTTGNIEEVLRESGRRLVVLEFGAPWCSACKELRPHMQKFAKDDAGRWLLGQVNGDASPELNSRFQIKGYPSLLALRNGREVGRKLGYNGDPRTYRTWVDSLLAGRANAGVHVTG